MNYAIDHCNPFDNVKENIWMKCEHLGRYFFAGEFLGEKGIATVLDLACAEGYGCKVLKEFGLTVRGADKCTAYVEEAKKCSKSDCRVMDFDTESFPRDFYGVDAIVSFETIEHLEQPSLFLQKVYELLKQDGYLILSFPNSAYEKIDENGNNYDPFHKHIFRKDEMRRMVESAGFSVLEEYGQALCNMMCKAESDAVKAGRITADGLNELFRFDCESIISMAKVFGRPDKYDVDNTYSFIWVLQKR